METSFTTKIKTMKINWDFVCGFLCCCLVLVILWASLWVFA